MGLTRLERVTFPLSEGCSNRLSYRPGYDNAECRSQNEKPLVQRSADFFMLECLKVPVLSEPDSPLTAAYVTEPAQLEWLEQGFGSLAVTLTPSP